MKYAPSVPYGPSPLEGCTFPWRLDTHRYADVNGTVTAARVTCQDDGWTYQDDDQICWDTLREAALAHQADAHVDS